MIFLGALTAAGGELAAHGESRTMLFGVAVFMAAVVAWGVVTALGLLWMRTSALISTLIFSFLLLGTGLGVLGVDFVPLAPAAPAGAAAAIHVVDTFLGLVCTGLAVWWIAYFARPRTQAAFFATRRHGAPPRLPVSIAVIAWFLLGGGGLSVLFTPLLGARASFVLGMQALSGHAAQIALVAVGAISMIVGLGLVELRSWARVAAMVWVVVWLINSVLAWRKPAAITAMLAPGGASMPLLALVISLGIAACLAQLYFLWTRQAAFAPRAVASGAGAGGGGQQSAEAALAPVEDAQSAAQVRGAEVGPGDAQE